VIIIERLLAFLLAQVFSLTLPFPRTYQIFINGGGDALFGFGLTADYQNNNNEKTSKTFEHG